MDAAATFIYEHAGLAELSAIREQWSNLKKKTFKKLR
jgi:hypothetical protein